MTKILFDTGPLTSGHSIRGVGTYVKELLNALGTKVKGADATKEDLSKYDVVHFTSFNPFFRSLPFSKPEKTKFVLTIYDLIPLIYPKHYPPGLKGTVNWSINKYLIKKNVDAVVTISETSKKDICRYIGINPQKVYVTHLAPRSMFNLRATTDISKKYKLPGMFALYAGDINYNKNIPTLIQACKQAKISLVITGKQAGEVGKMNLNHPELKHLKNLDWTGVIRPGQVSDEELVSFFHQATVYIQASFYEGFGLPVVEAFKAGTPVIATKTQALVEIGEGAALFADPRSPEDFAKKIESVINNKNLRDDMINKGKRIAEKLSWQKTAEKTLEIYKK